MSERGTNRGGRTLSSRSRYSTGRGRIVVQDTPIIPSPHVSLNQSLSHAQPTISPHIHYTISITNSNPNTLNHLPLNLMMMKELIKKALTKIIDACILAICINRFNPSTAICFLTKSIKSKLDWFCPTWGHASLDQKLLWFTEFKVIVI